METRAYFAGNFLKLDIGMPGVKVRQLRNKKNGLSAVSSKDPLAIQKQPCTIESLIEDTLLRNDLALLDIICDSARVVGDAAAIWSKGILHILSSRLDKDSVQNFLKKALRNRILNYGMRLPMIRIFI